MKNLLYIFILTALLTLTGCQKLIGTREEIDKLAFGDAIALDSVNGEKGIVKVTIPVSKAQTSNTGSKSQREEICILTGTGRTVFEAVRNIHAHSDRHLFLGHAGIIIIGEAAAKDNILKYLDFIFRDHELPINQELLIVKNGTAEEMVEETASNEPRLSHKLQNLIDDARGLSISGTVKVVDFVNKINNEYTSAYIPCITLTSHNNCKEESEERRDAELNGYAVFKRSALVGYIQNEEARGLNWITNKIGSGIIVLKDYANKNVALEIITSKAEIIPKLSNGNLSVAIKVDMSSNIGEQDSPENIYHRQDIKALEKQQASAVKAEIIKALKFAQKNNADIFGISNAIYHRYPVQWQSLKGHWDEIFPRLNIVVSVNSRINRTYDIREPAGSKAGEAE